MLLLHIIKIEQYHCSGTSHIVMKALLIIQSTELFTSRYFQYLLGPNQNLETVPQIKPNFECGLLIVRPWVDGFMGPVLKVLSSWLAKLCIREVI